MDNKLKWTLGATVMAMGLGACNAGAEEAEQLEAIQAKACACEDKACTDGAYDDLKQALHDMKQKRATKENIGRIQKATDGASTCLLKQGVPPSKIMSLISKK